MKNAQHVDVAVLLATYNGSRYVEQQIKSLSSNNSAFTLHWLDDHSSDDTREAVRASAAASGIPLREWHQSQRLGLPATFFQLLECVDADIYLFCDQDDIWQPGKIDATVQNLIPNLNEPVLCFSDSLVFYDGAPTALRRESEVFYRRPQGLEQSRMFMPPCANGNTQGFTRPLREIFLGHRVIARMHAYMHDVWMYDLAIATGTVRILCDVPTTLYRQHRGNASGRFVDLRGNWIVRNWRIFTNWRKYQYMRRIVARHARGFILASAKMPAGQRMERPLELARLLAKLDRRRRPAQLLLLTRHRAWTDWQTAVWYVVMCLCCDAVASDEVLLSDSDPAGQK